MPIEQLPQAADQNISPVAAPLSIRELTEVLVRHYGLTEGSYGILIEFQIGVGRVGPGENKLPGAALGISKVGLTRAAGPSENVEIVDAASLLPESSPPRRKRKSATTKQP